MTPLIIILVTVALAAGIALLWIGAWVLCLSTFVMTPEPDPENYDIDELVAACRLREEHRAGARQEAGEMIEAGQEN